MDHPSSHLVWTRTVATALVAMVSMLSTGSIELHAAPQEPAGAPQTRSERPYIGAMFCDVNSEEAAAFQPQAIEGAMVWKLSPNSPAARAGVQAGDVIRKVNSQDVKNVDEFLEAFRQLNIGDRLNLSIQRGSDTRRVSLVLAPPGQVPTSPAPPANQPPLPEDLEFSSSAAPLSYEHPESYFRLKLPQDWGIHPRHRGRIPDDRFDTLLDRGGQFQVIIWRQPIPASQGRDQFMQLSDLLGPDGLQYPVMGFSETIAETNWSHLSIQYPELATQITYSVAIRGEWFWRFEFVCISIPAELGLPEPSRSVLEAIQFSGEPTSNTGEPPHPTIPGLPKDVERLESVFDGQSRSLGVELVSAGTPESIAMEIESPAGAAVAKVLPRTTAAAAGLRRGDLIVKLGDQEINTPEDVDAFLWATPVNQLVPLAYSRRQQLVTTMLRVATGSSPLGEYRHSTGGYGFRYFPNWRLHPNARQEEVTGRVYDYLTSRTLNAKLLLFHDQMTAPDPIVNLQTFLEEASQGFLEGYSGWLATGDIPIVFASGVVGREELQTLYRIAFVVNGQQYEINAFTSPLYDPAELPRFLQVILGSLEQPQ